MAISRRLPLTEECLAAAGYTKVLSRPGKDNGRIIGLDGGLIMSGPVAGTDLTKCANPILDHTKVSLSLFRPKGNQGTAAAAGMYQENNRIEGV